MLRFCQTNKNRKGFTLIEIAIVMVIIGILAGAGVSLMGMLTRRKARNESIDYMKHVKEALVSYANINGTLPNADTNGDGSPDGTATSGNLPYVTLGVQPKDSWQRNLKYEINAGLDTDRSTSCAALRTGLGGAPRVVDADGSSTPFAVAAILVSAGPMDADTDGDVFDDISSGSHQGDNRDGVPNYIRYPPTDTFDDMVTYVGANELYGETCEYLLLAVNNNSGSTVYAYDQSQGTDLGSIAGGGTDSFNIISGTRVEIRTAPNGAGSIVGSTPPTPITLAGDGRTIDVP